MQTSEPWYRQFDTWAAKADQYLSALERLSPNAPHHRELAAFADFSWAQLVFESNLIEGAGLSRGETRKVMAEYFPQLPSSYEAFRKSQHSLSDYITTSQEQVASLPDMILRSGLNPDTIMPSFLLAKKSRPVMEVSQHFLALQHATLITMIFRAQLLVNQVGRDKLPIQTRPDFLEKLKVINSAARDTWRIYKEMGITRRSKMKVKLNPDKPQRLITEELIGLLHELIARNLLPEDAGVPAGQYRIDNRIVGWDIMFPAPELVPAAMSQYEVRTHEVLTEALAGRLDRFLAAAQISYDFVRIHPFPDFNGRVSRLLLVMVLNVCGVPFPVTLRGDSKSKKRYFRALKFGNAGNLKPYATLIAMRVVQAFESVEQNLAIAGLPSILSFAKTPGRRKRPTSGA